MSSKYHTVTFAHVQDFVDSCKLFDDSFMNLTLGLVMDDFASEQTEVVDHEIRTAPKIMLAVYHGEDLVVTMAKMSPDFPWTIESPRNVHDIFLGTKFDVSVLVSPLVSAIAAAVDPNTLDKVVGPAILVDALLEAWATHLSSTGILVRLKEPFFDSRMSYATLSSLPSPPLALAHRAMELATLQDVESLVPLYIDFTSHSPLRATSGIAKRFLTSSVQLGRIWICRIESQIVGYCAVGRATPNTIAIRNLYVSPPHRRKGVGEALTTFVTRLYLGADTYGSDLPSTDLCEGVKREVLLNAIEQYVERLYERCGFLFDKNDPQTGKPAWLRATFRGVEYL